MPLRESADTPALTPDFLPDTTIGWNADSSPDPHDSEPNVPARDHGCFVYPLVILINSLFKSCLFFHVFYFQVYRKFRRNLVSTEISIRENSTQVTGIANQVYFHQRRVSCPRVSVN